MNLFRSLTSVLIHLDRGEERKTSHIGKEMDVNSSIFTIL